MKKIIITLLATTALSGCANSASSVVTSETLIPAQSQQLVVVVADDWQAIDAQLYRFERVAGQWQQQGQKHSVVLGRTGLAWGIGLHPEQAGVQKQEGDGKAPAGIFELGTAFGYLDSLTTNMTYQGMTADDYCIDVKGSPFYNQMVDKSVVGEAAVKGSSEWMRRDIYSQDNLYKKGLVVKHNSQNIDGAGSCIFMHLWRAENKPTAGCTAMTEQNMDTLLAWLDEQKKPLLVSLPASQYQQKQLLWKLPTLK
ncbi:MAG: L,D-transpeptidase family protein [Pseudoalteromonas prydzensis]|uniref:L,D-transpeptidase family protein n=1 Tax=Pseudoalteromonas prydzensis TaxID=182141 RepID=UPI003F98E111